MTMLRLRKLADRSAGARTARVDAEGNVVSIDPWPSAGLAFEGDPPKDTAISAGKVAEGIAEGWLTVEGAEKPEVVPAGSPDNPWGKPPHVFQRYSHLTFQTVDGPVRYAVVRGPGKYPGKKGEPAEVTWVHTLKRED